MKIRVFFAALLSATQFAVAASTAAPDPTGPWLATINHRTLGEVQVLTTLATDPTGGWSSGPSDPLWKLQSAASGVWVGQWHRPKQAVSSMALRWDGTGLTGTLADGAWAGDFRAARATLAGPLRDYPALTHRMLALAEQQLYHPGQLNSDAWRTFRTHVLEAASVAKDDFAYLLAVSQAWDGSAFSHFRFWRPNQDTATMLKGFMAQAARGPAVELRALDANTSLMTVHHFMGEQVMNQLDSAFEDLLASGASRLVIDLRGNGGGEFAALQLAARLAERPQSLGYFIGRQWWNRTTSLPTPTELAGATPLVGHSVAAFLDAVRSVPIVRIDVVPHPRRFTGPVVVLTSNRTASAAEMLSAFLKESKRAKLVGQTTRGAMLASDFMDVGDGFKLMVPVADYYTVAGVRIEAAGVTPDIATGLEHALEQARALLDIEATKTLSH